MPRNSVGPSMASQGGEETESDRPHQQKQQPDHPQLARRLMEHLGRLRNPKSEFELGEGHTSTLFYVGNCIRPFDADLYTASNNTKIDEGDVKIIEDVYKEEMERVYNLDKRQYSALSGPYYFKHDNPLIANGRAYAAWAQRKAAEQKNTTNET